MKKTNAIHFHSLYQNSRRLLSSASPDLLSDANALLYSVKSFTAAMLAYYIALSINLEQPSWAIITVYIVSQTSVGASLSRSLYRLTGTAVGAGTTVLIVPTFVNSPILCSVILTGWITFCLYLSLLERTPRAYGFVLAGYTASLIGFPTVTDPGTIFDVAMIRVQEIVIGVFCAAIIHSYVLPVRISGQFNRKLSQALLASKQRIANTLNAKSEDKFSPLNIALELQFLQGMSHHVPYDFSLSVPGKNMRKRLHDSLARLEIVNCELRDRLSLIKVIPLDIQVLVNNAQIWLSYPDEEKFKKEGQALINIGEEMLQAYISHKSTLENALHVSFIQYLTEAVFLIQQCYHLFDSINYTKQAPEELEKKIVRGYVFHRDLLTAARTALGAFIIILSGCMVWIFSAWPEGATAVSILGVCCTLFGSFDTPAPHIVKYILGSLWGVIISLTYSFAILPQVSNFITLVSVLAPVYLLAGALQAKPATTFMAMGITLTLPVLCELGAHYKGDFAAAINTSVALFSATGFAVFSMSFLQTVQADAAIKRMFKMCQHDINPGVKNVWDVDEARWLNLMIDRIAMTLPRLSRSKESPKHVLNRLLYFLRLGIYVRQLRRCNLIEDKDINDILHCLIHTTDLNALIHRITSLTESSRDITDEKSRYYVCRLVDLYCVLKTKRAEPTND